MFMIDNYFFSAIIKLIVIINLKNGTPKKQLISDIAATLKTITNKVKSNHGEIEVAKTIYF